MKGGTEKMRQRPFRKVFWQAERLFHHRIATTTEVLDIRQPKGSTPLVHKSWTKQLERNVGKERGRERERESYLPPYM